MTDFIAAQRKEAFDKSIEMQKMQAERESRLTAKLNLFESQSDFAEVLAVYNSQLSSQQSH